MTHLRNIQDLIEVVARKSAAVGPQIIPSSSSLAGEPRRCIAALFPTDRQRREALKYLSHRQRKEDAAAGECTELLIKTRLDLSDGTVTVVALDFTSSYSTLLSQPRSVMQMTLSNPEEMDPLASYFNSINGYKSDNNEALREVYAAAYSLQIICDAIPSWNVVLGVSPITESTDVDDAFEALFSQASEPLDAKRHTGKQRRVR